MPEDVRLLDRQISLAPDKLPLGPAEVLEWWETLTDLLNQVRTGTGDPEGVVVAPVGTLFLRRDGGTDTTLYVKETGTGDTGWIAK